MSNPHKQSKNRKGNRPRAHRRNKNNIRKQRPITNTSELSLIKKHKNLLRDHTNLKIYFSEPSNETKINHTLEGLKKSTEVYDKLKEKGYHNAVIPQIQRQSSKLLDLLSDHSIPKEKLEKYNQEYTSMNIPNYLN